MLKRNGLRRSVNDAHEQRPLFGLQASVRNYQKITNTNAAANNTKTKAATIFIMQ